MNPLSGLRRHAPAQNDLLAALPKADYERLSGSLVARNMIVGHGGTLEVESSEQAGTVFTARLPDGR